MNCDFRIKEYKKYILVILLAILLSSVIGCLVALIFYLQRSADNETVLTVTVISVILFVLSCAGIHMYRTEEFCLENGTYFYRKPFKRDQSAHHAEIEYVSVRAIPMGGRFCQISHFRAKDIRTRPNYMIVDVVFYDKNGNKLINFYDDGLAFEDGSFERSLRAFNIKIKFKDKIISQ